MNDRIRKVRKALDLTQKDFGAKIGTTQNAIGNYETGHRSPSNSVIDNICKTFHVSESWLRTGEGEMFISLPHNDTLERDIRNLLQSGNLSFKERLISLLSRLEPKEWEKLEDYLLELVSPEKSATARTDEMTDEEAHAELDRQLLDEKEQAGKLQVLQESNSSDIRLA